MALNNKLPPREELILEKNQRKAICRCWQSKKFPFCDGSHRAYNENNNDNLGPIIINISTQNTASLDDNS